MPKPIDRLFLKMATRYGKHWFDMWAGIPIDEVKADWYEKLQGMPSSVILMAVDRCGKFPPTQPEFLELCKAINNKPKHLAITRVFTKEEIESNLKRLRDILAASPIKVLSTNDGDSK